MSTKDVLACLGVAALSGVLACGGDDAPDTVGDTGTDNPGDGDPTAGDGDPGDGDPGDGDPGDGDPGDGDPGDGDPGEPMCDEPMIGSSCTNGPNPASIISGQVWLGDVSPSSTQGTLQVALNHLTLGGGATGGFPHTAASFPGQDLGGGAPGNFQFDFCTGGEMWSEENCGYHLNVYLDLDNDGTHQQGEPAGITEIEISCADAPACHGVILDCMDGPSCFAFTDPGGCACSQPSCNSPIVTCG